MLQQANAAGSRVAPQPPQPYTLDSNIVAPGTVSVQQARPPAGFAFAKETGQRSVADWLAQVEHFCVSMRVAQCSRHEPADMEESLMRVPTGASL